MLQLWKLKLEELPWFDIAVAKYIAMERSDKDVEVLQGVKESIPVNLLSKSRSCKKPKPKKEAKPSKKKGFSSLKDKGAQSCYHCFGNYDHNSCPFKKEKCHHCSKTGQIVRACKSKKRETQAARPPINYVDSDDWDSDDYLGSLEVNNVSDKDWCDIGQPQSTGKGSQDKTRHRLSCVCTPIKTV